MHDVIIAYRNTNGVIEFARVVRPGDAHPDWFLSVVRRTPGQVCMDWAGNGADGQFHFVEAAEWDGDDFVLTISAEPLNSH